MPWRGGNGEEKKSRFPQVFWMIRTRDVLHPPIKDSLNWEEFRKGITNAWDVAVRRETAGERIFKGWGRKRCGPVSSKGERCGRGCAN